MLLLNKSTGNHANIYQNGELIEILDLSEINGFYTFTIENEIGMNKIEVENGSIRVSESDCRDASCVRQGWISSGARPIVCLPHRLVIQLENATAPDVDAVVG
jgi:hypothetical protein